MPTTETEHPKLSHLIREGAKLHPQTTHSFCREINDELHTCALGGAYEALTGAIYPGESGILTCLYKKLRLYGVRIFHPQLEQQDIITIVVSDLNDGGWTREQIANYLEKEGY